MQLPSSIGLSAPLPHTLSSRLSLILHAGSYARRCRKIPYSWHILRARPRAQNTPENEHQQGLEAAGIRDPQPRLDLHCSRSLTLSLSLGSIELFAFAGFCGVPLINVMTCGQTKGPEHHQ